MLLNGDLKMVEEIDFENRKISNFQHHMTLTLDRATWHTVVHHSLTSTYIPNSFESEKLLCGRTYVQTYVQTDGQTSRL